MAESGLLLETCTFEVRFDKALLLWDRSGRLWLEATERFPGLEPTENISPNATQFRDGLATFAVDLDRCSVIFRGSSISRRDVLDAAPSFFEIVRDVLELTHATRLGFRPVFRRMVRDQAEAMRCLRAAGVLTEAGCPWNTASPEWIRGSAMQRWKDGPTEFVLTVRTDEQTVRSVPPAGVPAHLAQRLTLDETHHVFTVDIDYSTNAEVPRSKLDAAEWLRGAWAATEPVVASVERRIQGQGK